MRILVTGSAGFIGSNLVNELLEDGHRVLGIDNFYSGRRENVAALKCEAYRVVEHDVREPLDDVVKGTVHQIYHLACPASPKSYQMDPDFTWETSVLGIKNVLRLAKKRNVRALFTSTSEVYGDPKEHPQKESYWGNVNPMGERSCYDEGKRAAETYCYNAQRMQWDVRVARIFNTYGPFMSPEDGRVVSNFINQALDNQPLTIYGDGQQTRSFCYVEDMVRGLKMLMNHPERIKGAVNLGNPNEFTVYDLARQVQKMTWPHGRVVYEDLPADDPTQRRPDITRAKTLLGWEPKVQLAQGLERTIAYFRALKEARESKVRAG